MSHKKSFLIILLSLLIALPAYAQKQPNRQAMLDECLYRQGIEFSNIGESVESIQRRKNADMAGRQASCACKVDASINQEKALYAFHAKHANTNKNDQKAKAAMAAELNKILSAGDACRDLYSKAADKYFKDHPLKKK